MYLEHRLCGNIKPQLFELGKICPRCLRIVYEDLVHPPEALLKVHPPKLVRHVRQYPYPVFKPKNQRCCFLECCIFLQVSCLAA